ncbi:hypothetical protein LBMAG56_21130 [Verrucomicrobiota bacterium]|nr:hypothetical protein LBMAG56_21130 [Verrucomicrobiota bacterium]
MEDKRGAPSIARHVATIARVGPSDARRSGFVARVGESARGLAHSKTLARCRGGLVGAPAFWSAVTCHRFLKATCRRQTAGGVEMGWGVHGSRQRWRARVTGAAPKFDGDKSPAQKR